MAISDEELRREEGGASSFSGDTRRLDRDWGPGGAPGEGQLLEPGARLGRYEIRGLLGFGGMGRVYAAHDPTLDREVAIKALAHAFHGDPVKLKRFEREAKVLAALSHPNVAAIYGFEELEGAQYLVLEKVDGDTLAQRLASGPLPWRDAVSIAAQIAEGLAEAHAKGVIHRDLKPSNVMLSSRGRVKLVDFGLAKGTGGGDVGEDLTATIGAVVGTAPYMSPEQIRGEELDERTDVWAFGCLLYEMLSGRRRLRRPLGAGSPRLGAARSGRLLAAAPRHAGAAGLADPALPAPGHRRRGRATSATCVSSCSRSPPSRAVPRRPPRRRRCSSRPACVRRRVSASPR